MYTYNAKYISNHDGNTITLLADCGFGIHKVITVRLLGVNAYELNDEDPQKKTKAYDAKHFVGMMLAGGDITIETHKDKDGGYTAVVYVRKEEYALNDILLKEGLAKLN
jgi:endonuclease YncB( thermonuclease family)